MSEQSPGCWPGRRADLISGQLVEALTSLDSDKVHATNCKASLTWFPFAFLGIEVKARGKVLVVEVAGSFILGIGLEVCSKSGVTASCSLHNLLQRIDAILIPCDCLLTWEVDLKAHNIGLNSMHLISHQPPKGLTLRDIVCIQIELDLILTCAKLHGGMVMALVWLQRDQLP